MLALATYITQTSPGEHELLSSKLDMQLYIDEAAFEVAQRTCEMTIVLEGIEALVIFNALVHRISIISCVLTQQRSHLERA